MHLSWDQTHHDILLVHIEPKMSWAEYDSLIEQMVETIQRTDHDCYLLITRSLNNHMNGAMLHVRSAMEACIPLTNLRLIVNVFPDEKDFGRIVVRTILKTFPEEARNKWQMVNSIDAAYSVIESHRNQYSGTQ